MALSLVDTSAISRQHLTSVAAVVTALLEGGDAATCALVDMEVAYSTRSAVDLRRALARRGLTYRYCDTTQADLDRAVEVMAALADAGAHRAASLPDLIIAAVAERHGCTIVHYDSDYDRIAGITGQPVQWVVPRGSVP